jgi:hypothetical protein
VKSYIASKELIELNAKADYENVKCHLAILSLPVISEISLSANCQEEKDDEPHPNDIFIGFILSFGLKTEE